MSSSLARIKSQGSSFNWFNRIYPLKNPAAAGDPASEADPVLMSLKGRITPCGLVLQIKSFGENFEKILFPIASQNIATYMYVEAIFWLANVANAPFGFSLGKSRMGRCSSYPLGIRIFMQLPNGDIGIADQILETLPNCRQIFHQKRHFMRCLEDRKNMNHRTRLFS